MYECQHIDVYKNVVSISKEGELFVIAPSIIVCWIDKPDIFICDK